MKHMAEIQKPLIEARRHDQRFRHRLDKRSVHVHRRADNRRSEGRFSAASAHRKGCIAGSPERALEKTALPTKQLERLARVAALADR